MALGRVKISKVVLPDQKWLTTATRAPVGLRQCPTVSDSVGAIEQNEQVKILVSLLQVQALRQK